MKVTITKYKELEKAVHKNNIEVGFKKVGKFVAHPVVGEPFWLGDVWRTSPVTEILSNFRFKTLNSEYHYKISK